VTEAGWHSNNSPNWPSSPDIQGRYVVALFTQSMAADIDLMIWWMLYDPGGYFDEFGLVAQDGTRKPSYDVFRHTAKMLATAEFVRKLSNAETGDPALEVYEFSDAVNRRTIYVAWRNPLESSTIQYLKLSGVSLKSISQYGATQVIHDGHDGTLDGRVTIPVSGQPVFIERSW
jgi:hypothetical protein